MKNKLIFFVDDDKMILNLLEYTFKSRQGMRVQTFFSGEECLQNMHMKPDMVVMDHVFQEGEGHINGMETLKKLKQIDKNLTVIVLSCRKDENLISEFLKNGASKYIAKENFFIDELIESIDSIVQH
jgi:DNA-binding NarL/FixJ family response regulator